MTPDEIRNTVLKAIYSEESLIDILVLKGGNALRLLGVTNRESQDLDFSIKEEIRFTKEKEGVLLEKSITKAFDDKGYLVNTFTFKDKPKTRKDYLPPFWGGYSITFSIIDKNKYADKINKNNANLNRYAEELLDGTKKIEIDLSFDEYTEHKVSVELEDIKIFLYSPLMIVYEKIRASCQQLDDYPLTSSKVRARDLYDIYTTLTNSKYIDLREEVLNSDNFYILEKTFSLKEVPLNLLTKLNSKKEDLEYDYNRSVKPQIPQNDDTVDFDFLFSYNEELFNLLYEKLLEADPKVTF